VSEPDFRQQVSEKARRLRRSRSKGRSFWAGVGLVGSVGWIIVLPTVAGALAGRKLDAWLDTELAFTLGLMLLGLASGGYTLWRIMAKELR
jgi:ATP synthase protein I